MDQAAAKLTIHSRDQTRHQHASNKTIMQPLVVAGATLAEAASIHAAIYASQTLLGSSALLRPFHWLTVCQTRSLVSPIYMLQWAPGSNPGRLLNISIMLEDSFMS